MTEPVEPGGTKRRRPRPAEVTAVTDGGAADERDEAWASPASSTLRGLPSRRSTAAARAGSPDAVDEEALALAHRVVDLASDKKAADIVLLDVRAQTAMADYFVICTGASDRQLGAIADGIVEGVKAGGVVPLGREGDAGSRWLLIDLGSVIVHVMSGPERDFYQLEKLWSDASLLLHVL